MGWLLGVGGSGRNVSPGHAGSHVGMNHPAALRRARPPACTLHPKTYTLHPSLCSPKPAPCILHPAPHTQHPTLCSPNPAPCIVLPKLCSLHPACHNLYPKRCTPRPPPCTLHPASQNLHTVPCILPPRPRTSHAVPHLPRLPPRHCLLQTCTHSHCAPHTLNPPVHPVP